VENGNLLSPANLSTLYLRISPHSPLATNNMGFLYSQLFVTPSVPNKSLKGETVIVTGSNVGLGKESARQIAKMGADKLILAVRNVEAGNAAKADIEKSTGSSTVVEVWPLDLSSYESVQAFAKRASQLPRLDALLENAGIATGNVSMAEGHERTITVNVISTFLLALLLLPKLKASAKEFGTTPRLTIVSSEVHGWSKFPEWKEDDVFAALDQSTAASMKERYQTSKLLEVLVVRQIAPMFKGSNVTLNMLNPGLCHSELSRDSGFALTILKFFLARTTEVGSRTLVHSAIAGGETNGVYFHDGLPGDEYLSPFVTSEDGKTASAKVWKQLSKILESIQPGVTGVLNEK
jgi:NAD(P)-dependent dehydrogenase (short-subunit alcohol dehydrogenase family)